MNPRNNAFDDYHFACAVVLSSCAKLKSVVATFPADPDWRFSRSAGLRVARDLILEPGEQKAMQQMLADQAGTRSLQFLASCLEEDLDAGAIRPDATPPQERIPWIAFCEWILGIADQLRLEDGPDGVPPLE